VTGQKLPPGLDWLQPRDCPQPMDDYPFETEFRQAMAKVKAELQLAPGDIYENCFFHPAMCVEVNYDEDSISGVSMIDGSYPRNCSLRFCGVRKLTVAEAWEIRQHGPLDEEDRQRISSERKWWRS